MEHALKQGLAARDSQAADASSSRIASPPLSPSLPPSTSLKTSHTLDDESLLHQLRREAFERAHQGQDYFRDSAGRYNISLDDRSSFFVTQPEASDMSGTGLQGGAPAGQEESSFFERSSVLGDLPLLRWKGSDALFQHLSRKS